MTLAKQETFMKSIVIILPLLGDLHSRNFDASSGKMQYYEASIDNNLIDLIVHETNCYAEQTIGSSIPRRHSRSKKWKPTSKEEMHVFIALIILQGIIKKPTNEQYWSKRHFISTLFFSKVMSYRRFNLIYRFLHFSDNETFVTETHECPKLSKIWPVLKYLTIRFKEIVTPDRDVTIDETDVIQRKAWLETIYASETVTIWNKKLYAV
ncbi:piggyBac transposable element-derived protein 4 [Trichonephila clavipes]|nr:piggyBac transposable element-derived protein 4 [Trichonephila clavipes]